MTYHHMLPCVECLVMTRADRPRCPICQRRATFRFYGVTLMLIVLGALWLLLR
jgi:RNA polymerase subunit RPABC4/transcription elongation factor Spt4